MRKFISLDMWKHGEKQVQERGNFKRFTLTQPKQLFSEDYYTVRRAIAVDNCPVDVVPEKDFPVYEFSYMDNQCCCVVKIVDQETAEHIIRTYLTEFLLGKATQKITDYFPSCLLTAFPPANTAARK